MSTMIGRGTHVPLHPAPHRCPKCGEQLMYNYVPRPGDKPGYYLFGHSSRFCLLTFSLEKDVVVAGGGFGSSLIQARIADEASALHLSIDAKDSNGHPWLTSVAAYVLRLSATRPGGIHGVEED